MFLNNKPSNLTINNVKSFFNFSSTSPSGLKKGMLIKFNYFSPDRKVNDKTPLVFIMEKYNDRVVGLNLHYQFDVLSELIEIKNEQLTEFVNNSREYKAHLKELENKSKVDLSEGDLPSSEELEAESNFDVKKVRVPTQMLEDFTADVGASSDIFRVYLYRRMTGVSKLSFKT